jgi:OHCU decarboxylase
MQGLIFTRTAVSAGCTFGEGPKGFAILDCGFGIWDLISVRVVSCDSWSGFLNGKWTTEQHEAARIKTRTKVKIEDLNKMESPEADLRFRDCCGSREWARRMAEARPFNTSEELIAAAETIWNALAPADWLEAFSAHPKIGAKKAAPAQQAQSAEWSKGEQAGMDSAETHVKDELADANRLYEKKFGYIFIVCATGKTAGEMLALCRARLDNSPGTELPVAAEEQRKITEIRLLKLIEEGEKE